MYSFSKLESWTHWTSYSAYKCSGIYLIFEEFTAEFTLPIYIMRFLLQRFSIWHVEGALVRRLIFTLFESLFKFKIKVSNLCPRKVEWMLVASNDFKFFEVIFSSCNGKNSPNHLNGQLKIILSFLLSFSLEAAIVSTLKSTRRKL